MSFRNPQSGHQFTIKINLLNGILLMQATASFLSLAGNLQHFISTQEHNIRKQLLPHPKPQMSKRAKIIWLLIGLTILTAIVVFFIFHWWGAASVASAVLMPPEYFKKLKELAKNFD